MLLSRLLFQLAACVLARTSSEHQPKTASTQDGAKRYVVLDTTGDSPSWTAVLMAMEASSDPSSDFTLLGVLATESEDLDSFNKLMDETGMSDCLKIVASKELDLYPPDGYTMDHAPETVRQLIEWVKAYPHQVTIYASASLTTVAYAEAADAAFAGNVKGVLMVANLDDEKDFRKTKFVGFHGSSPFLRDQDAFLATISGSIPLLRIMGPLQPVLSGSEIAQRVQGAVTGGTGSPEEQDAALRARKFAWAYLMGHFRRRLAGHQQAILLQEPGMAVLVDPSLITGETDVEFEFEYLDETKPLEQQAPILSLRQIDNEEITPGAKTTVIHDMNEEKFWDMLVHTRSRDWTGFCQKKQDDTELGKTHDEL